MTTISQPDLDAVRLIDAIRLTPEGQALFALTITPPTGRKGLTVRQKAEIIADESVTLRSVIARAKGQPVAKIEAERDGLAAMAEKLPDVLQKFTSEGALRGHVRDRFFMEDLGLEKAWRLVKAVAAADVNEKNHRVNDEITFSSKIDAFRTEEPSAPGMVSIALHVDGVRVALAEVPEAFVARERPTNPGLLLALGEALSAVAPHLPDHVVEKAREILRGEDA